MKQIQMFLLLAVLIFVVTALGQETKSAADASAPTVPTSGRAPGTVLRDCPECPEMVVIPAGSFTMGSSAEEKRDLIRISQKALAEERRCHSVRRRVTRRFDQCGRKPVHDDARQFRVDFEHVGPVLRRSLFPVQVRSRQR